ncbi:MAG: hypothetical protein LBF25_00555 [Puniceicoccales bacterium]|jgi:hypothetical protein|nr:hypothetical protein [Puniceicoccales bacterium]
MSRVPHDSVSQSTHLQRPEAATELVSIAGNSAFIQLLKKKFGFEFKVPLSSRQAEVQNVSLGPSEEAMLRRLGGLNDLQTGLFGFFKNLSGGNLEVAKVNFATMQQQPEFVATVIQAIAMQAGANDKDARENMAHLLKICPDIFSDQGFALEVLQILANNPATTKISIHVLLETCSKDFFSNSEFALRILQILANSPITEKNESIGEFTRHLSDICSTCFPLTEEGMRERVNFISSITTRLASEDGSGKVATVALSFLLSEIGKLDVARRVTLLLHPEEFLDIAHVADHLFRLVNSSDKTVECTEVLLEAMRTTLVEARQEGRFNLGDVDHVKILRDASERFAALLTKVGPEALNEVINKFRDLVDGLALFNAAMSYSTVEGVLPLQEEDKRKFLEKTVTLIATCPHRYEQYAYSDILDEFLEIYSNFPENRNLFSQALRFLIARDDIPLERVLTLDVIEKYSDNKYDFLVFIIPLLMNRQGHESDIAKMTRLMSCFPNVIVKEGQFHEFLSCIKFKELYEQSKAAGSNNELLQFFAHLENVIGVPFEGNKTELIEWFWRSINTFEHVDDLEYVGNLLNLCQRFCPGDAIPDEVRLPMLEGFARFVGQGLTSPENVFALIREKLPSLLGDSSEARSQAFHVILDFFIRNKQDNDRMCRVISHTADVLSISAMELGIYLVRLFPADKSKFIEIVFNRLKNQNPRTIKDVENLVEFFKKNGLITTEGELAMLTLYFGGCIKFLDKHAQSEQDFKYLREHVVNGWMNVLNQNFHGNKFVFLQTMLPIVLEAISKGNFDGETLSERISIHILEPLGQHGSITNSGELKVFLAYFRKLRKDHKISPDQYSLLMAKLQSVVDQNATTGGFPLINAVVNAEDRELFAEIE